MKAHEYLRATLCLPHCHLYIRQNSIRQNQLQGLLKSNTLMPLIYLEKYYLRQWTCSIRGRIRKAKAEVNLSETHLIFLKSKHPLTVYMDRLLVREGSLLDEARFLLRFQTTAQCGCISMFPKQNTSTYSAFRRTTKNRSLYCFRTGQRLHGLEQSMRLWWIRQYYWNYRFRASFKNPNSFLRHGETAIS